MAKIKLDLDDIETREFVIFDDFVFLDDSDAEDYIDSCDAELLTDRFFPDARSLLLQPDLDIDELRHQYEDDQDEFEEAQYRYDEEVDMLMDEFGIRFNVRISGGSTRYRLLGKYDKLRRFCSRYCGELTWTTPGEALEEEFEENVIIDTESGDMKYVLFSMCERR